ncbi:MAG TPA: sulfatase-like hydrolase/transferase [Bacteroidales bacterium]|nr:sulfatase-like hydrolase/transferase [Bacteroidales bacterium]HPJ58523.1 sulfatase-like hydrolase/transferase [Bacteroidales bacterium]HPR11698.1 sulfatase-like hydrolase/transferase [Bacteroidales bacterium]HRW85533.1 sulfatase-like hydrolase/transferase [Bacteroidales bacterium]
MKDRLKALFFYAIFWILYFLVARLFFIMTHLPEASLYDSGEIAATFWHGLRLDISAAGYIFLIPVLILIPGLWTGRRFFGTIINWYSVIVIIFSSVIVVADTLLYKYWGFRMDYTPFMYLNTPGEAAASVTFWQIAAVSAGIILLSASFIWLYRSFIAPLFINLSEIRYRMAATLLLMILWGLLIIPIRGGLGLAPIYAGSVYFSRNTFVNHTAINVVWNVGNSLVNKKYTGNPYVFDDPDESLKLVASITGKGAPPVKIINNERPNILILVMESFGSALTGPLGGDTATTPRFNGWCSEGVLFSGFYASGFRTDKAMPAIINGYPAQPAASIMKDSRKTESLPGIVKILQDEGYNSSFWYGGDINFANFRAWLINCGFSRIITQDNFNPADRNSKWGIHDHILFSALLDSMNYLKEPFLRVVLSLSSHEPFDVPADPVFEGRDELTKFRNSLYYTDSVLGDFLDYAAGTEWWKNTLVIVVADHFRRNSGDLFLYAEDIFQIPMLWLGGVMEKRDTLISRLGSQVDIPLTLLHQMNLDGEFPFSKDLLSDDSHSFAFYTFNEGFGFITDSSKYIYDHKLGSPVVTEGKDPLHAGKLGKAYLQVLFDDFLER